MVEIERKFLVDINAIPIEQINNKSFKIRQGYLMEEGLKILRVRTSGNDAFLTYKSSSDTSIRRLEYEVAIPLKDAETLLETCSHILEKTRIEYIYEGLTWEIDIFHGDNEGLIIAEIELETEHQPYWKPWWVTHEVTDDARYLNSNLIKYPHNTWGTTNG